MNYLRKRKSAFGAAFSGLVQAFKTEAHLKIHGIAALVAINLGFYFSVTQTEWFALLGCIALVISLELINSALEKLCDLVMPEENPVIKYVKDVAAGAVLIACVLSVVIAILIFRNHC